MSQAAPSSSNPHRHARTRAAIPLLDPMLYQPHAQRPVRSKMRELDKDTLIMPHRHAWAQLAISTGGVIRVSLPDATYLVPPHRAVWVPPGVEHAVTLVETARLYTLYFLPEACGGGVQARWMNDAIWQQCRVLEASALLRALVVEMDTRSDQAEPLTPDLLERETHLSALLCGEIRRAPVIELGVRLPQDKRLKHLCEAVIDDPMRPWSNGRWTQGPACAPWPGCFAANWAARLRSGASKWCWPRPSLWRRGACRLPRSLQSWATPPVLLMHWCAVPWV